MTTCAFVPLREELKERIRGEYLEMPGLQLTCAQAQRLWNLDHDTCCELLGELVASCFLAVTNEGRFARCGECHQGRGKASTGAAPCART